MFCSDRTIVYTYRFILVWSLLLRCVVYCGTLISIERITSLKSFLFALVYL